MAAIATTPDLLSYVPSEMNAADRRYAVDSVLGTMAAEGEVPCAESLRDMERFVDGELTLEELSSAMLQRATQ